MASCKLIIPFAARCQGWGRPTAPGTVQSTPQASVQSEGERSKSLIQKVFNVSLIMCLHVKWFHLANLKLSGNPSHTETSGLDWSGLQNKLAQSFSQHKHFNSAGQGFVIHHYAGMVTYDVDGFVERNKDILSIDLIELMKSSKNKFLQKLFQSDKVRALSLYQKFFFCDNISIFHRKGLFYHSSSAAICSHFWICKFIFQK